MSLTSFLVSRNWASSPLRLLLTLTGIALGTAIVVAIYVMDHNTIQSRLQGQDTQRGHVDLEVLPVAQQPVADTVAALQAVAGVQAVAVWREARGFAVAGALPVELAVYGLSPLPAGAFAHYAIARGSDLAAADDGGDVPGILLGEAAAQTLGVDVGAVLQLGEPPAVERVECRNGTLTAIPATTNDPFVTKVRVVGVLAPDRLGKRNQQMVAVAGLGLANRLRPIGANLFHLLRHSGSDLDRLKQQLRDRYTVQDARAAMIGEGADERAFRNGLKILGGLALLLGMFVVFQTLSHSLMARIRQLGLLRCLGTGVGAITRIFLFDAMLLGIVGSALGVSLGLGLALLLQHYRISSLGVGKEWSTFEIPWFPVLWTATLGVLFTLAGAMFPLVRARQVSPLDILQARGMAPGNDDGIDLLRGVHFWMFALLVLALPLAYLAMTPLAVEEGSETRVVLLQLAGILGLFGSVLLLAPGLVALLGRALLLPLRLLFPMAAWLVGKVITRGSGRVSAAVCGLSAVLLALIGLKSITWSLGGDVKQFAHAALDHRVFLECPPITAEQAQALAAVPGVGAVEAFEGEERGGGFLLRGLAVANAGGKGGPLEGSQQLVARYADQRARTLVASHRLAKAKEWKDGFPVVLRDRTGLPVTYEVLVVDDRAGFDGDERAFAITSPYWLRTDFCIPPACVSHVTLRLQQGADGERVGAAAREALMVAIGQREPALFKVKSGEWIRDYFLRDVGKDFRLFDLLLFLMLVLAGVGLLNGMTIAMLGRVRELGVLRALGITRGALFGSFVLEGVVIGALASLLSVGLGAVMATVLVLGMNSVAKLNAPIELPYTWFLLTPVIAFATAMLASLVPGWRALRQSPSESVRYE